MKSFERHCRHLFDHVFTLHASAMALAMSVCRSVGLSVHHFGPDWNISTTLKFCTQTHVVLWVNCDNISDPLAFHLVPSLGQNIILYIIYFGLWLNTRQTNHEPPEATFSPHHGRLMSVTVIMEANIFKYTQQWLRKCSFLAYRQVCSPAASLAVLSCLITHCTESHHIENSLAIVGLVWLAPFE